MRWSKSTPCLQRAEAAVHRCLSVNIQLWFKMNLVSRRTFVSLHFNSASGWEFQRSGKPIITRSSTRFSAGSFPNGYLLKILSFNVGLIDNGSASFSHGASPTAASHHQIARRRGLFGLVSADSVKFLNISDIYTKVVVAAR